MCGTDSFVFSLLPQVSFFSFWGNYNIFSSTQNWAFVCTRPNIADIARATSPSWEEKLSSLVILGERGGGAGTLFVGETLKMFIVSISPQFFVLFQISNTHLEKTLACLNTFSYYYNCDFLYQLTIIGIRYLSRQTASWTLSSMLSRLFIVLIDHPCCSFKRKIKVF